MGLRPDENGVRHIKPEPAADVHEEMVTALKIRTANKVAGEERLVKTKAFQTDPSLQIRLRLFAKRRPIDCVEIVENRAVRIEKDIDVLMTTPGHFATDSEVLLDKKKITAERWITTAANALWSVVLYVVEGIRRRLSHHRAHAKSQIKLLSVRRANTRQNQTKGRTQKK